MDLFTVLYTLVSSSPYLNTQQELSELQLLIKWLVQKVELDIFLYKTWHISSYLLVQKAEISKNTCRCHENIWQTKLLLKFCACNIDAVHSIQRR